MRSRGIVVAESFQTTSVDQHNNQHDHHNYSRFSESMRMGTNGQGYSPIALPRLKREITVLQVTRFREEKKREGKYVRA